MKGTFFLRPKGKIIIAECSQSLTEHSNLQIALHAVYYTCSRW